MNNKMKQYLSERKADKILARIYQIINVLKFIFIALVLIYVLSIIKDMHKIALCYAFNDTPNSVINCFFDN
jgi:ABC-type dipeptide/oligopeptide/nickel transport system permease subunit